MQAGPTKDGCPLMTVSDYTRNAAITSNGYSGLTYSPIPALVTAGRGGRLLTNRDGYSTSYKGNSAAYNRIDEILQPGVFRLGATVGF